MSQYRRSTTPGATYFFTVVTYRRRKILTSPNCVDVLRNVIKEVKQTYPFKIDAWVVLPEHMHCMWTLPPDDADYSKRWGLIKTKFSKGLKPQLHREEWMTQSKQKHRESTIWQRRFWEHQIRDDEDYRTHMDYLHYNPVKHGLVKRVNDWPYSSFHRCVEKGVYSVQWGVNDINVEGEFGE